MRRYYCTLYPDFSQDTYLRITASLQLDPARKLSTYSKGMLRQAMIILAFASQARYVFFDETFDGLDPVMRQTVKGLIAASVAEGKLVPIIASHNLRELEDICDHVGVLHRGKSSSICAWIKCREIFKRCSAPSRNGPSGNGLTTFSRLNSKPRAGFARLSSAPLRMKRLRQSAPISPFSWKACP